MGERGHDELEARVLAAARAVDPLAVVTTIDPDLADTAAFCRHYGHTLEESGNCILVRSRTGDLRYAACVVQATRQLDLNRHSRLLVGARKASFASADESVAVTGMQPGGITPLGLPQDIPVVVDAPVMALDTVVLGGGSRRLKLTVRPSRLRALPTVSVADISRPRPR